MKFYFAVSLKVSLFSLLVASENFESKILVVPNHQRPQLFYLGFQKDLLSSNPFSFGGAQLSDISNLESSLQDNMSYRYSGHISSFPCTVLLEDLIEDSMSAEIVSFNNWKDQSRKLNGMISEFRTREAVKTAVSNPSNSSEEKIDVALKENAIAKTFSYSQSQQPSQKSELSVSKVASYLTIGGGLLLLVYGAQNSLLLSNQNLTKQRIIIARRKRLLVRLTKLHIINHRTYLRLLKEIQKKDWNLKLKKEADNHLDSFESEDTEGDLSNRKSGESVVKIKDMSFASTSR